MINFQTNPLLPNITNSAQVSNESFWKGVNVYFSWLPKVQDGKGVGWNFVNSVAATANSSSSFNFVGQMNLPGYTKAEAEDFLRPLYKELNAVGVNLTGPFVDWFETYPKQAYRPQGPGENVMTSRFGSRLFPRENFEDTESEAFKKTMAAVRAFVEEGGYNFHSVDYAATYKTAGWPGVDSAVNPHLRKAVMHATGYDKNPYGPEQSPAEQIANHARLNSFVQKWRDASPGSGAYMNEADTEEPNYKETFYGDNYPKLLRIKKKVDPWSLFYAVTMVSSDEWHVEGTQGLPTQQGRLCRVNA